MHLLHIGQLVVVVVVVVDEVLEQLFKFDKLSRNRIELGYLYHFKRCSVTKMVVGSVKVECPRPGLLTPSKD